MSDPTGFLKAFPRAFYDAIAYILPGGYLLLGYAYNQNGAIGIPNIMREIAGLNSGALNVAFVVVIVAVFYLVGATLTPFSFWLISRPTAFCFLEINKGNKDNDKVNISRPSTLLRYVEADKEKNADSIFKSYAGSVAFRNLTLASLMLYVHSQLSTWHPFWIVLMFVFAFVAVVRLWWLFNAAADLT